MSEDDEDYIRDLYDAIAEGRTEDALEIVYYRLWNGDSLGLLHPKTQLHLRAPAPKQKPTKARRAA